MPRNAENPLSATTPLPGLVIARARRRRLVRKLAAGAAVAGAAALANHLLARRSEARHPPEGQFVTAHGVRLHYHEAGSGPAVVLLHGNGVAGDDFLVSGLMGRLARTRRVIAIDRPGFGYSERPRGTAWTAPAQARLLLRALEQLDALPALVVGHSWGTLVAAEMALREPEAVAGLVLMSGYYRPTPRPDAVLLGAPAVPVLGDLVRYTVSPPLGRLMTPFILKRLFAPAPVGDRFRRLYPVSMSLRPSQLRAAAAESGLMAAQAARLAPRIVGLQVPTLILAGRGDRLVDAAHQSEWLAGEVAGAAYVALEGVGHMLHHTSPDAVADTIEGFAAGAAPVGAAALTASPIPSLTETRPVGEA